MKKGTLTFFFVIVGRQINLYVIFGMIFGNLSKKLKFSSTSSGIFPFW